MPVPGLDVLTVTGLLTLAANPVTCTVPKAPVVSIVPATAPIQYDNTIPVARLTTVRADTISPYGQNVKHLMFGLHSGHIQISSKTRVGGQVYGQGPGAIGCLYYDSVEITITLNPVIYIAREFPEDSCAYDAVLEHEKKHVRVDRWVANKYAQEIGKAVQSAVNQAGALGPYPESQMDSIRTRMVEHLRSAVESMELPMTEEQARLQQQVDSLPEYERVSQILHQTCKIPTYDYFVKKRR